MLERCVVLLSMNGKEILLGGNRANRYFLRKQLMALFLSGFQITNQVFGYLIHSPKYRLKKLSEQSIYELYGLFMLLKWSRSA